MPKKPVENSNVAADIELQPVGKYKEQLEEMRSKPFEIYDDFGSSYVDGIVKTSDGFQLNGRNFEGDKRVIYMKNTGEAYGPDNNPNLGFVGYQMYDNREDIFKHFGIELPESHLHYDPKNR